MKIKNRKNHFLVFVLVAFFSIGLTTEIYAADTLMKKETYFTLDKNETRVFDDSIMENGKKYILENVEYKIVDESSVLEDKKVTKEITSMSSETDGSLVVAENVIVENGITYKLIDVLKQKDIIANASVQEINEPVVYYTNITFNDIPSVKEVEVKDEVSGEVVSVECELDDVVPGDSEWVNSEISILYENYDSDEFIFNGSTIVKNENLLLGGYEELLLNSVGLNSNNAHVVSISWNGEPYMSNGIMFRNGIASVQVLVPTYIANYVGVIEHPELVSETYTFLYEGTKKVETGELEYEIEAIATYHQDNGVRNILIGILFILLLIILILYMISKKDKKEKNNE